MSQELDEKALEAASSAIYGGLDEVFASAADETARAAITAYLSALPSRDDETFESLTGRALTLAAQNDEDAKRFQERYAVVPRELLREALDAFVHIEEYWNGSRTDQAMYVALDEIIMTASAAADKIRAALTQEKQT